MIICGPTLLDLQALTSTTVQEINSIFSISAAGYVIGSLTTGVLFGLPKVNIQFYIAVAVLIMGLSTASIPWFSTLTPMLLAAFVMNVAGGGIDSGCNYWTIKIWGSESMATFQMNSMFFGAGSLIAPSLTAPFLSSSELGEPLESFHPGLDMNGTFPSNSDPYLVVYNHPNSSDLEVHKQQILNDESLNALSGIRIPYLVVGLGCFIISAFFAYSYFNYPKDGKATHETEQEGLITSMGRKIVVVTLMSLFSLGFAGICIVFPRYLTTFAVKGLKISKTTGAYMTSLYWAGYTFSRLATLPLALRLTCRQMLTFDCVLMLVGSFMLVIFGSPEPAIHETVSAIFGLEPTLGPDNKLLWGFWAGIATLSVGASSIFPLLFAFMEQNMPVASWMPALLDSVYGLGEFVYPIMLGVYIETLPELLLYIMILNSSICAVFFAAFAVAAKLPDSGDSHENLKRLSLPRDSIVVSGIRLSRRSSRL